MSVRAAVIPQPNSEIEIRTFDEPDMQAGAALLRTVYSEVCGTDVHLLHGRLPDAPYPLIPGHINVGVIEKCNGPVTDAFGEPLSEGETVTFLDVHETCNNCWYCLVAKASTRCPHRRVYGITYGAQEGLLGGWSEKIYIKPGVKMVRLDDLLSPEEAIAGGCGLPTAFHAIERGEVGLGDHLVIQGAGPVGLMTCALAKLSGAQSITVVGASDDRLDMAGKFGADRTLDIRTKTTEQRRESIRQMTGGCGADITIEATGNPAAIPEGMRLTRDAGVYVVVGQYTDAGDVEFNPHHDLNRKHIDVRATWGIDFSHFYRALQAQARFSDNIRWCDIISEFYGLDDAGKALKDVEQQRVVKAVLQPNAEPSQ